MLGKQQREERKKASFYFLGKMQKGKVGYSPKRRGIYDILFSISMKREVRIRDLLGHYLWTRKRLDCRKMENFLRKQTENLQKKRNMGVEENCVELFQLSDSSSSSCLYLFNASLRFPKSEKIILFYHFVLRKVKKKN